MVDNIEKLFRNLESNDPNEGNEARTSLLGFFQKTKEPWLVSGLMDYYARNSRSPSRIIDVLVKAHNPHDIIIFDKLSDWLRNQNRLTALNIFSQIIHKQPSWLIQVYKHKFFKDLLKSLQNDNDIVFLMNGLLCIVTLLPIIPSLVPNFLNDLFEIFNSIALIKHANSKTLTQERSMHLNLGLKMFFDLLYGMYPCNFLFYLKESSKKENNHLALIIRPLLESVRIHPLLVLSDQENELNKSRWNKKEPHDVVSECDNLSITYLAYTDNYKDSLYIDISNELLSIENSTPIPENQKCIRTKILSPTSRLLNPSNLTESSIWSPLNVISQKSPMITSAQNTPLPVPYTPLTFHGSNVKITPNNMVTLSGTSPPEAAVEATPESTPLKEIDIVSQNISYPHANKNPLAVRAILNKTGEDVLKPSQLPYSARLTEMLSHRNESQQYLEFGDTSHHHKDVTVCTGRNRFLSERNDNLFISDNLGKKPPTPKLSENIISAKSCPDINQLIVASTNTTNKTESIFIYETKSTQTTDCSLSNKLIELIEENNMLKRKQLLTTPVEPKKTNAQDILDEYINKIHKIDTLKQSSKSINDMKEQLQLLSIHLQYERYRREIHAERNRRLMGRSRDKRALELENKKLKEQLQELPDSCRSCNKYQDLKLLNENKQLKQKLKEQGDKMHQLEIEKFELQEKLNSKIKCKKDDKEKIDQLNGELFELSHSLDEARHQILEGKKCKEELSRLESELILMGEIQLKFKEKLEELDSIRVREEEFKLFEKAYSDEVKELKSSLEEKKVQLERAKYKNEELQIQNKNKEQAFTDQKRNLKTVKDSYEERLKALSSKYEIQKTIILQMEQTMFEMQKNTSGRYSLLSPESDKIDFASSVEKSSPLSASLASSEGLSVPMTDLQSLVEGAASSRSTLQTSPLKSTVSKILPSTSSNYNKG